MILQRVSLQILLHFAAGCALFQFSSGWVRPCLHIPSFLLLTQMSCMSTLLTKFSFINDPSLQAGSAHTQTHALQLEAHALFDSLRQLHALMSGPRGHELSPRAQVCAVLGACYCGAGGVCLGFQGFRDLGGWDAVGCLVAGGRCRGNSMVVGYGRVEWDVALEQRCCWSATT